MARFLAADDRIGSVLRAIAFRAGPLVALGALLATPTTLDPGAHTDPGSARSAVASSSPCAPRRCPLTQCLSTKRPIAVMIDNYAPDARPESGLSRASMVFETLVEGGITRLMAVFTDLDTSTVGPVRSTRIHFNSWAAGLGAILVHDGGNVDALQQLPTLTPVYDVDAQHLWGLFRRSSARLIPHNEYTNTGKVRAFVRRGSGAVTVHSAMLRTKADTPPALRPPSFLVTIQFSSADYNVNWRYDRVANDFVREMDGIPQIDAMTRRPITAKNVIVMRTDETPDEDPFTPGAIEMRTTGSGRATVYQDGRGVPATWRKQSVESPLRWLDAGGRPLRLDCGTTWVEVIPDGNLISQVGGRS